MSAGSGALINVDGDTTGYAVALGADGRVKTAWWAGHGAGFGAIDARAGVVRAFVGTQSDVPLIGTTITPPSESAFLMELDVLPHIATRESSGTSG